MKKIHTFFTKHPKLKRATKILGIVGIVLSFIFNAVIIASAIITANNDNVKQPLIYDNVNVPIKPLANNSDTHYWLSSGDLSFNTFYSNLQDLYGDSASYNDSTTFTYDTAHTLTLDRLDVCFYTTDMLEYEYNYYTIQKITITKTTETQNGIPYVLYACDMAFNNSSILCIHFNVYYPNTYYGSEVGPIIYLNCYFYNYTSGVLRDYSITNWYLFEYANTQKGIFYDLFIKNSNKTYVNGYWDGYDYGYTSGYNHGYGIGYDDGEQAGASNQMTSDPFTLIGKAFQSVASILNIQVLPNLTLGVLVFTPLIVTIIIVVIKFIRG